LHTAEQPAAPLNLESTEDWKPASAERSASTDPLPTFDAREYVIGPEDVLDINVFEAPEMNACARFSERRNLPAIARGGRGGRFTPRELEDGSEALLHQKYMKDPHVGVFVRDMQSIRFRDGRGAETGYFPDSRNKTCWRFFRSRKD